MSDIFICYSRRDSAIASKLRERLEAQGWSVFMDLHIDAGHRWSQEIERELAAARAVLTLWSSSSIASRFVMDEAHEAADRGIIFPALIEDVRIPYGFRQFQTPSLTGWNGDGKRKEWNQVLASLRKHLGGEAAPAEGGIRNEADTAPAEPRRAAQGSKVSGKGTKRAPEGVPARKTRTDPAGQNFRDKLKLGGEGPLMVVIPAGRFLMGSPPSEPDRLDDEGPQHEVRIARPFAMGVYAVTFDEYDRYCEATKREKPGDEGWGRANRPVINVSWNDAHAYCVWLTEQTGRPYRLPSEAEWEYACRAGTTTPFHFGNRLSTDQANFAIHHGKTLPVGSFPPNAFGLFETHGNVWEWCQDAWHGDYAGAPSDGSAWEGKEAVSRVLRGGSWNFFPRICRAAYRFNFDPVDRFRDIGFRVCCSSPIE